MSADADELVPGRFAEANNEVLLINSSAFKARYESDLVKAVVGSHVKIEQVPTNDLRSYHVSSERIAQELGFRPKHSIEQAVRDLVGAFKSGKLPNAMTDDRYYNIKVMQAIDLQ